LGDLGRSQRIDDEGGGIAGPGDDVDLLALQLADHGLDAAAAHADAGADRIDAAVVGDDADLGAAAGIARYGADLDDRVIDLRHFLGEQLGHELRMGARQEDLRAAGLAAHVEDIGAHAIAGPEGLARQELVAAQHRLGAAEIDGDVAELDALDQAVHDFADAVLVFLELALALGLAHALHDHLLGGLGGDAAEIDGRQRIDDEIADLGVGIAVLGVGDQHLRRVVLDGLDHLAVALQLDLAAVAIDLGADVVLGAVFGAAGLLDGLLHRDQHLLAVDALLAGDGVGHLQQLDPGLQRSDIHRFRNFQPVRPHGRGIISNARALDMASAGR